jgi:DNA polymerase III subunit epsilon
MFRTRVNPRERIPPAATAIHTGREHRLAHSAAADVWATARVLDCQIARYPELSADPTNLHRLLVEVDIARRFRRSTDSEIVMGFGKYQQVPLIQVAKRDPGYLEWLLTTDLLDDARNLVCRVLDGLPPKPPVPQSTQPSD